MTGASESCGKGLEMRGKRTLLYVKEWVLIVHLIATFVALPLSYMHHCVLYMAVFMALSSALFIGTVQCVKC